MNPSPLQRRSLHDQLAGILHDEIVSGVFAPGSRLPGMRELARRFNVSINTLRTAILILEKTGLVTLQHGTGVFVRRQDGPWRLGIFSELDILQPRLSFYHTQLPRLLRRFAEDNGALARLYVGSDQLGHVRTGQAPWDLREDIERGRLNGIAGHFFPYREWVATAVRQGVAVVGDNHLLEYGVSVDFPTLLREGIRRLHAGGCRRIAVMGWADPATMELAGQTLTSLGLDSRPKWVTHALDPVLRGAGWEEFREVWMAYKEKPDGLVVCDDMLFAEAIPAIVELRISVPQQLQVVAHSNKGARIASPFPVTYAETDPEDVARRMAAMLLKRVRGESIAVPHEFSPIRWEAGTPREGKAESALQYAAV